MNLAPTSNLDDVFLALSDPTRRAILSRLARKELSVNELVEGFSISQPAISKHLKMLERAGLVERGRDGQRRPTRLKAQPMQAAVQWLEEFERFWTTSFGGLDGLLAELKDMQKESDPND